MSSLEDRSPFAIAAVQYAGGSVSLCLTVFIGWLALLPLFETFGLTTMAGLMGWFGYGPLAPQARV